MSDSCWGTDRTGCGNHTEVYVTPAPFTRILMSVVPPDFDPPRTGNCPACALLAWRCALNLKLVQRCSVVADGHYRPLFRPRPLSVAEAVHVCKHVGLNSDRESGDHRVAFLFRERSPRSPWPISSLRWNGIERARRRR